MIAISYTFSLINMICFSKSIALTNLMIRSNLSIFENRHPKLKSSILTVFSKRQLFLKIISFFNLIYLGILIYLNTSWKHELGQEDIYIPFGSPP